MRPSARPLLLLSGLLLLAFPASSEEVIRFTNGTFMAVKSFEVKAGMVHVELDENSRIAFPEYMVETIDEADDHVRVGDSRAKRGPRPKAEEARKEFAEHKRAEYNKRNEVLGRETGTIETDPGNGLATWKPFAHSSSAARRRLGAVGTQNLRNQPVNMDPGRGYVGTRQIGNKYQIPGKGNRPRQLRTGDPIVPLQFNGVSSANPGPRNNRRSQSNDSEDP